MIGNRSHQVVILTGAACAIVVMYGKKVPGTVNQQPLFNSPCFNRTSLGMTANSPLF